jgi:DNA-binding beta-propeller fold protein YncE
LAAINARSGATRYTISVTTTATKAILLASPDGRRVYLAPLGENTISVYDGEAARRLAMYAVGDAIKDVVLSPNGRSLYVLTERRQIPIVIDTGAGAGASQTQVLDRLADNTLAGATRLVYAEYQSVRWLCILQPTAQQVALIDLAARSVRTIAVGREPTALAAVADSDTVYVTNKAGNTLSVISLSKAVVVDTIDVRSRPSLLIVP